MCRQSLSPSVQPAAPRTLTAIPGPTQTLNRSFARYAAVYAEPMDPRQTYAANATQALKSAGRTPRRPVEFRSQCGEDGVIWTAFAGQLDGFYIEVGAFNGVDLSVSFMLDCLGWRGLLIEPIPDRYAECVRNRQDARVVHAALGAPGGPSTTTFNVTADRFGGMLSSVGGGHAEPGAYTSVQQVTVPLTTMNALLADHTGPIDVAVIDVEGSEVPLLQGFDLRRFRPRLLIVEDTQQETTPLTRYMASTEYLPIGRCEFNRLYAHPDGAETLARRIHGF
jgi:FkbM family methyltransferase